MLSLTIVGALKAVGIILVIAMLIAPGAIAYLLTTRFERMLPLAVAVAVGRVAPRRLCELLHRFAHRRRPSCLIMSICFVAAFLFSRYRAGQGERPSSGETAEALPMAKLPPT